MADAGRYRRRRYAPFCLTPAIAARRPHQPHYQSSDYNRLNGGIQRWFAPITDTVAGSPVTMGVLKLCWELFSSLTAGIAPTERHVEMHQFRIEPGPDSDGCPTPEGVHRDGVDWVCALLVRRTNVEHGVTHIHDNLGKEVETLTLAEPLDTVFLDDRRVMHGVTDINRVDCTRPGFRDVLVVTFRTSAGSAS